VYIEGGEKAYSKKVGDKQEKRVENKEERRGKP
jgi:hypothetical protein